MPPIFRRVALLTLLVFGLGLALDPATGTGARGATAPVRMATVGQIGGGIFLPFVARRMPKAGPVELEALYQLDGLNWDMAVDGDLVYAGLGPHIAVWRLDASGFTLLGRSPSLGGDVYGLALQGDHLYAAASEAGLAVLDVRVPTQPEILARLPLPSVAIDVAVVGATAYVGAGESGLRVVDVSDPRRPRLVGAFAGPAVPRTVLVLDDRTVYVMDSRWRYDTGELEGHLWIIDVMDPTRPRELARLDQPGWEMFLDGSWLYYIDTDGVLTRMDVSRPAQPARADEVAGCPGGCIVRGDRLWAYETGSVVAYDLADAGPLRRLGEVAVGQWESDQPSALTVAGDRLLWAMPYHWSMGQPGWSGQPGFGLGAVEITNPSVMRLIGRTSQLDLRDDQCVPYREQLLCAEYGELRRIDVSAPATASVVARYPRAADDGSAEVLATAGDLVYVYAYGSSQLRVLRLLAAGRVETVGLVDVPTPVSLRKGYVDGGRLYGLNGRGWTVHAFDVSDPSRPRVLGELDGVANLVGLAVSGGLGVGVMAGPAGNDLVVLDLSAPPAAPVLARPDLPFVPWGVHIEGHLAYVVGADGLAILDLTHPRQPVTLGRAAERYQPGADLRWHDGRLYVYGEGLAVYDVTIPTAPRRVATFRAPASDTPPDYDFRLTALWPADGAIYVAWEDSQTHVPTTVALSPAPR